MLKYRLYMLLYSILGIFVQRYIVYTRDGILMDRFTGEVFIWK